MKSTAWFGPLVFGLWLAVAMAWQPGDILTDR
jgi:hypothetical protein